MPYFNGGSSKKQKKSRDNDHKNAENVMFVFVFVDFIAKLLFHNNYKNLTQIKGLCWLTKSKDFNLATWGISLASHKILV